MRSGGRFEGLCRPIGVSRVRDDGEVGDGQAVGTLGRLGSEVHRFSHLDITAHCFDVGSLGRRGRNGHRGVGVHKARRPVAWEVVRLVLGVVASAS